MNPLQTSNLSPGGNATLIRLRTWRPAEFLELSGWLMNAHDASLVRNVLDNMGEEYRAEPHERDVVLRVRAIASKLAAGDESLIERVTHRMRGYCAVPFWQLALQAARAAGLATAWDQACRNGEASDGVVERLGDEFDGVLELFCELLAAGDTTSLNGAPHH